MRIAPDGKRARRRRWFQAGMAASNHPLTGRARVAMRLHRSGQSSERLHDGRHLQVPIVCLVGGRAQHDATVMVRESAPSEENAIGPHQGGLDSTNRVT